MSSTPFEDLIKQAAEVKYVVIPASDYLVVLRDVQATKSSTGKEMLKIFAKVIAGPHKDATAISNETLSPENPQAVAIFLRTMSNLGITEEWLAALPPREDGGPDFAQLAAALKGRAAVATFDVHEWAGEDRNGITKFKKPTDEQEAEIRAALDAMGADVSAALGAPSAGPSDPFAASAAAPAAGEEAF